MWVRLRGTYEVLLYSSKFRRHHRSVILYRTYNVSIFPKALPRPRQRHRKLKMSSVSESGKPASRHVDFDFV
jgi:hypothetical protein